MLSLSHNYFQVEADKRGDAPAAGAGPGSARRYALGLLVLLLVDVLWVVSADLTKYIYTEKKYDKPFFVTYVRTSMLMLYLLAMCFTNPGREPCPNRAAPPDYTQLLEHVAETEDENFYSDGSNGGGNGLGDSTFVPVRAGETTDSDDAAPRAVRFNKVAEVRVMSAAQAGEALLARLSWQASRRAFENAQRRAAASAARTHLKLAFSSCIPWFVANYLFRLSLSTAQASSATLFTSSYGALALALGAIFSYSQSDRFSFAKAGAVLLTAMGLVAVCTTDPRQTSLTSALMALGSAVCYAAHITFLRQEFRRGKGTNSPLFFGLVGAFSVLFVWPLGGALHATSYETFEWPSMAQWSWLLLDGFLGVVLSEALWLLGRNLTSSITATAALAFTAPLAFCTEGWYGAGGGTIPQWAGAALAGAGWGVAAVLAGGEGAPFVTFVTQWWRESCCRSGDRLTSLRYIPELDEQSEALMASEEPT